MDAPLQDLIAAIHRAGVRCVLVVTGGGAGAVSHLLSVPGGSRSVLEAIVPYDARSLTEFLGQTPQAYCSLQTARQMAGRALDRARWLAPGQAVLGIACTASLRSDRPKHGEHRFHIALQNDKGCWTSSLTLAKGARDREQEELVLDLILLNCIAEAMSVAQRALVPLREDERIRSEHFPSKDAIQALIDGQLSVVCVETDGRLRAEGSRPPLLLPGSFNPLHAGHLALAEIASQITNQPAAFEIGVVNADKPSLSPEEVRRRMAQFCWCAPVWLTRAPTFVEKADLFPGTIFVVGVDTAQRIIDPRFYDDSPQQRDAALEKLRQRGCRFLVAARVNAQGVLQGLNDLTFTGNQRDLFAPIASEVFRVDLSSTQLRKICPTQESSN